MPRRVEQVTLPKREYDALVNVASRAVNFLGEDASYANKTGYWNAIDGIINSFRALEAPGHSRLVTRRETRGRRSRATRRITRRRRTYRTAPHYTLQVLREV